MTLDERLKETRAKFEKEQEKLIKEEEIKTALGKEVEVYEPVRIYQHSLYGSSGSITFKPPFAESLKKGKTPDRFLLGLLLGWFPPVPRIEVRDGCLSFRPVPAGYDPETDPKLERATLCDKHGMIIKIDTSQHSASFEWYGPITNGLELWEFEVHFPLHALEIGTLDARAVRWGRGGGGPIKEWSVCQFHPSHALCNAQVTRWGTGGPEYPNDFTLSFDPDSGNEIDFVKLIKEKKGG